MGGGGSKNKSNQPQQIVIEPTTTTDTTAPPISSDTQSNIANVDEASKSVAATIEPASPPQSNKELTEEMKVNQIVNASVAVFENFEKLIKSQDLVEKEKENPTMFNWLKKALPLAHLSPALKRSIKRLLGNTEFVSAFEYMGIFEDLQEFCQDELLQLGAPLQQLYAGSEQIQSIGKIPTMLHPELSNQQPSTGSLRQDNPLVGLSAGSTLNLNDFNGESIYIHFLRLLALLLNDLFQQKVKKIVEPLGGEHKGCAIKGDARMRNKALAPDDHRYEKKPRPAHNIDIVRCCVTCEDPAALMKVIAALSEEFSNGKSGVGRVKNGFALDDDKAAESYHYRSYMVNLVVDFGFTFGELLSRSESMEVLEKYVNAPPENPKENWGRWRSHAMAAVEELKSAARSNLPVVMVCEVQAILSPYLKARKKMHFLYKVARADSDKHLALQFAEAEKVEGRPESGATWLTEEKRMVEKTRKEVAEGGELVLYNTCMACLHSFGFVAAVSVALEMEGVDINQADANGTTSLSIASFNGHPNVVKLLLGMEGVDVNQVNVTGSTPIFYAAQKGHLDVVKVLLGAEGIDVNAAESSFGHTPLKIAAENGHLDVVKVFVALESVDINQVDGNGQTVLFIASGNGHLDVVKVLLGMEGINVINQAEDNNGYTPLAASILAGRTDVARLLLQQPNIDVNKGGEDWSPLELAKEYMTEIVQLLVDAGAVAK